MNEYEKDKLRIQAVKSLQRIAETLEKIAEMEDARVIIQTEPTKVHILRTDAPGEKTEAKFEHG